MPPLPSRNAIARLMNITKHTACPCHACRSGTASPAHKAINQFRKFATPVELAPEREYAFEVAASNLRFGQGVAREVGMDFENMKAQKVVCFSNALLCRAMILTSLNSGRSAH